MGSDAPSARISGVRFVAVDEVDPELAEALLVKVSRLIGVPCRLEREPLGVVLPMLEGRAQADADRLLELLEARAGAGGEILVGVAAADIGHPIFTHFFGRARRHGRAAIVSLARLAPEFYGMPADRDLLLRRAAREAVHELGHVAGLPHCEDFGCLMHFAPNVETIDLRGEHLCNQCAAIAVLRSS